MVDSMEILFSRFPPKSVFKKAWEFEKKRNMAIVGSSDSHFWKDVGDAYTIADGAKNLEEFKKAILEKKTRVGGQKSRLRSLLAPLFAKINIIGNPPKKK